jgi:hypothetical protein
VKIDAATKDECGFALTGGPTSGAGSSGTTPGTAVGADPANLPAACKDITPSFDSDKTDVTSIYNLKLYVCVANPTASWMKAFIGASFVSNGGKPPTWQITSSANSSAGQISAGDALKICQQVDSYLKASTGTDADIEVSTSDDGAAAASHVLAKRVAGGTCAAP